MGIVKQETSRVEYKQILTDDLEKEAVAFLNTDGGHIHFGVRDDGSVVGIKKPDEVQLKIKDRLFNNVRPSIMGLFDIDAVNQDGKTTVVVHLAAGMERPYYVKQKGLSEAGCFSRVGSAAQPMTEEMISRLLRKRHPISLSNMVSRHQDLTFRQLKIYYEGKNKLLNENFAQSLDLVAPNGKFNYAAYLFSDTNRVSIRVAKYEGTTKVDLIENEDYGDCSLVKAMQKVLDKFEIENITQARISGLGPRKEKRLVHNDSLREIIINAFAHNDYSVGDTPIFEIFSDRFEITSYGCLVDGLSQDEFFAGVSKPRNREIMRIFRDLEYVEHLGSGMTRIMRIYDQDIFNFLTSAIRVTLRFDREIGYNDKGTDETTPETTPKTTLKTTLKNHPENHPETTQKPHPEITQKNHPKINQKNYPETTSKTTPETTPETTPKTTSKTTPKNYPETTRKIIGVIKNNPFISVQELADLSGLTLDGVKWNIKKLKQQKRIRRVGPNRGGHWEVLPDNDND